MSNPADIETTKRPLRADARRNRERIVEAAKAAFSEIGLETQMEDVARRAGVGVGTLYRHFTTKNALVHALVVDKMERIAEFAQEALDSDDSPGESFARLLWYAAERQVRDRALAQVLSSQPAETWRRAAEEETKLAERAAELLARAQAAGEVRPDARPDDIPLVMSGLGAVVQNQQSWERYMQLVLDGFRTRDAGPLPGS